MSRAFEPSGRFGPYGGAYLPETLVAPVDELCSAWDEAQCDPDFHNELKDLLRMWAGRPTALTPAPRFSAAVDGNVEVWLKREDLNHTGAHKLNNALGQALLAKRMGKTRIIAETGAGQHGVATATVAAMFSFTVCAFTGRVFFGVSVAIMSFSAACVSCRLSVAAMFSSA